MSAKSLRRDTPYYLAGPMSGFPEFNYPTFESVSTRLRNQGFTVISAHAIDHPDDGVPGSIPWTEYMRGCIAELTSQHNGIRGIIALPNWRNSHGAIVEMRVASALGMDRFELSNTESLEVVRLSTGKDGLKTWPI